MTDVRITKLTRHEDVGGKDFYTANVSANGTTLRVDNRLGSWTTTADPRANPGARNISRKEVVSMIARKLQERLRRLLKGEARANEDDATFDVATNGNGRPDAAAIADRVARAGAKAVPR